MKKITRIDELMKEAPATIESSSSLASVVEIIRNKGYSHVPVTENGVLVGIVSKTDLISKFITMLDETTGKHYTKMLMQHIPVGEIMHKNPIVASRGDDVKYATELLLQGEFHGVIVVDKQNRVQGIVTAYDILKSISTEKLHSL